MSEPQNRSSALPPEVVALVNTSIASAVAEAVKAAMASQAVQTAELLKAVALTPERLQELKKPYEDPESKARKIREQIKFHADEKQRDADDRARKALCRHRDKNEKIAVCLVHNFPDRQPRGICPICQDLIHPREWRIEAPTEAEPLGHAVIVPEHKDYLLVRQVEAMS